MVDHRTIGIRDMQERYKPPTIFAGGLFFGLPDSLLAARVGDADYLRANPLDHQPLYLVADRL